MTCITRYICFEDLIHLTALDNLDRLWILKIIGDNLLENQDRGMKMSEKIEKRHEHHGRSSKGFLDSGEILNVIGINKGDRFLDLGSGEGYFSLAASQAVGNEGLVYAFDVDTYSIARLKKEIAERTLTNIEASVVDVSQKLPLANESVNLAFMSNVLHGLAANGEADGTLKEIARVTVRNGMLAIVEFKKQESPVGPPLSIRLSSDEVDALAG
jgi:SAM-dependent methyltransferase